MGETSKRTEEIKREKRKVEEGKGGESVSKQDIIGVKSERGGAGEIYKSEVINIKDKE